MVDRESIQSAIENRIEVIETSRWYIAVAKYNGLESAAQSKCSRENAIEKLADRFYERAKEKEEQEEERKRREARREENQTHIESEIERSKEIGERLIDERGFE